LRKTEFCVNFTFVGSCSNGNACRFAHGDKEIRQAPEKETLPSKAQEVPYGASDGSSIDGCRAVYQPVLPCLAVPLIVEPALIMHGGCFGARNSNSGQELMESPCKTQWDTQVDSSNLSLAHMDAQQQPHCATSAMETSWDVDGGWQTQASHDRASCIQDFSWQRTEATEKPNCKEACDAQEAAGFLQQVKEQGAFWNQDWQAETDLKSCQDIFNDELIVKNCEGSQHLMSRQTTADSSSSFVIDKFSRQTSEWSEADTEIQDAFLCVKNTFLEWKPAFSAKSRSKSAGALIDSEGI